MGALSKHRRTRSVVAIVVVAALPLGLVVGCGKSGGQGRRHHGGPVPVTVAKAVQKPMPVEVRAIGNVEAFSTVEVAAQVTGEIRDVHFKEGDNVKKGDLLFSIDTSPYRATLGEATARLEKDKVLAAQARDDEKRYQKLLEQGLATQQEYDTKRSNAAALDATLAADRSSIASARINVQYAAVRAPIEGRTGSLLVHAGNVVRANDGRSLVVIRRIEPIYVRFAVPERYLSSVKQRMAAGEVVVRAHPRGSSAPPERGTLTFIENTVDTTTGTIDIKARFDNKHDVLWPGQFVDVTVELSVQKNALVVPDPAVESGQSGTYVYVIGADHKAALRHVQVERHVGDEIVLSRGVKPGESVVTDGQVRLRDGAPVQLKKESPIAPGSSAPRGSSAPAGPRAKHRSEARE